MTHVIQVQYFDGFQDPSEVLRYAPMCTQKQLKVELASGVLVKMKLPSHPGLPPTPTQPMPGLQLMQGSPEALQYVRNN